MIFRTTLFGNVITDSAMKQATQLAGERARTIISIQATTGDNDPVTLTVELKNTGATSITDFEDMDVVVQYPGGSGLPQRLTYTESSSAASGQWNQSLTSTSDKFEPGLFNPGETMIIEAKPSTTEDETGRVTVATPNGVTDNACFDWKSSCP